MEKIVEQPTPSNLVLAYRIDWENENIVENHLILSPKFKSGDSYKFMIDELKTERIADLTEERIYNYVEGLKDMGDFRGFDVVKGKNQSEIDEYLRRHKEWFEEKFSKSGASFEKPSDRMGIEELEDKTKDKHSKKWFTPYTEKCLSKMGYEPFKGCFDG